MSLTAPADARLPQFDLVSDGLLRWSTAYWFTLGSAGLFLVAALLTQNASQVDPMVSGSIALVFALLAGVSGVLLILTGGVLAALPYFMIGAGLFFGLGTFLAVVEPAANNHFTLDQQAVMLPKVNIINALAIFLVVASAGLMCGKMSEQTRTDRGMRAALGQLDRVAPMAIWLSVPVHGIEWVLFPGVQNPVLHTFFDLLGIAPLFGIFLGGVFLHRLAWVDRAMLAGLIALYSLEGLLSLGKLVTVMPVLAFGLGLWLGGRHRIWAGIAVLAAVACYFVALSNLVAFGRGHAMYDPLQNTLGQRAHILGETMDSMGSMAREVEHNSPLSRFSPTQFSAFFIASHDEGFAGNTMRNALVVLVPRVLWADKPIIAPGLEMDGAWRGMSILSSLAIGFPAEAYWNLGWPGVLGVSCYIGLMVGWFTRKWMLFRGDGLRHVGIFLMGAMVVKNALWVETSIVGSYIGLWIKLALIIMFVDFCVRVAIGVRARRVIPDNRLPPAVPAE